jgi:hypothetical protein
MNKLLTLSNSNLIKLLNTDDDIEALCIYLDLDIETVLSRKNSEIAKYLEEIDNAMTAIDFMKLDKVDTIKIKGKEYKIVESLTDITFEQKILIDEVYASDSCEYEKLIKIYSIFTQPLVTDGIFNSDNLSDHEKNIMKLKSFEVFGWAVFFYSFTTLLLIGRAMRLQQNQMLDLLKPEQKS